MAYTTSATTKGGREGRTILEDGKLALAMALPKEMGGNGHGHNPEQLFALGYSSCYGQAILALGRKHGIDGAKAEVTVDVSIEKDDVSFALAVEIKVRIPGANRDAVQALADEAHQICPYTRATRGNVPATITIL